MSKFNRFNLLKSYGTQFCKQDIILNGVRPSPENRVLMNESFHHFVYLVEDLAQQMHYSDQKKNTILSCLTTLFIQSDFSDCITCLKCAYDIIIGHVSGKVTLNHYGDFKDHLIQDCGFYDGHLFTCVRDDIMFIIASDTVVSNDVYKNAATSNLVRCSAYFLFFSKLKFSAVGLEENGIADYLSYERENATHPNWDGLSLTWLIRAKLRLWLKDYTNGNSLPHFGHGPGSTADVGKCFLYKQLALDHDQLLDYSLSRLDMNFIPTTAVRRTSRKLERCSKLVFVPKNITKLRSISMEPTALQYYQQGIMKSLSRYFEKNKYLSKILHLSDQSVNKSFAYHGSITNEYATLDLSHASDSVTLDLVKSLFKGVCNPLYRWLIGTRSTHTLLPDGSKLKLFKFAPMGSALSFPIESLIFAAITSVAVDLTQGRMLKRGLKYNGSSTIKVYGDDIIVPTSAANLTINMLRLYGFTPNESKSFKDGPFKESCGGNYFCGVDITPLKYSITYDITCKGNISAGTFNGLCTYANSAYTHGFPLLRLSFIHKLLDNGYKPVFCNNLDESPYIFSPNPTNFHLTTVKRESRRQTSVNYQRVDSVINTLSSISLEPGVMTMAYRALVQHELYSQTLNRENYSQLEQQLRAHVAIHNGVYHIEFDYCRQLRRENILRSVPILKKTLNPLYRVGSK